jgi:primosomal protein N' (replication factor Y)
VRAARDSRRAERAAPRTVSVVDALVAVRSTRFDQPLSYDATGFELSVGDVVRVPLGNREVPAFVVGIREAEPPAVRLRRVLERIDVPRAFDETGLRLAQFIAEHYVCTLGEALDVQVLAGSVPRMREQLVRAQGEPNTGRFRSIPGRLIRCIWRDLPEAFSLDQLLRHAEARRAGDRAALLRYVGSLVRAGALRRERVLVDPRTQRYRVRVLEPGDGSVRGRKARAFCAFVRAQPGVPRADALLSGFSAAVIARAVAAGAVREREVMPSTTRKRTTLQDPVPATSEQRAALERIRSALEARRFGEILLYGVTGSGKTYVYVEAIKSVVRAGGRAIVLVPEISLTPQTARRFEEAFGERVAVLHSALSERERFAAWLACREAQIDVVVGARSAVFAPLRDVRLLVVDESHEPSYKQENAPRYHAIAVARERMRLENGILLLGSATPSVESFAAAKRGRIGLIEMRTRATQAPMPGVRIVDLTQEFASGNRRIFAGELVAALAERLERGEKSVLFINRRGSAGFMLCRSCGYVPQCRRCSVGLSVHRGDGLLRCHYCDFQVPIPSRCLACGQQTIREFGIGTEKVAQEVKRLFPTARVLRMDSDTTTRIGDHARILTAFEERGDVLVGTQMVAKGLDYPTVTLVGVVTADIGLHVADFRASERTFALIAQVCGRSGRVRSGQAIVQTYAPEHPAIVLAAAHDYDTFAARELQERASLRFPPATRLIYLGVIGRNRSRALAECERYAQVLRGAGAGEVLGPAPYPIARLNAEWRFRLVLKTRAPAAARAAIRERILPLARAARDTRLAVNVDP